MTCLPARPRSSAAARAARERSPAGRRDRPLLEHQGEGLLIGQHILAEGGAEARQPLADLRQPRFFAGVERRAGADEMGVIALQHARLLGGQPERLAPPVEVVDPARTARSLR